MHMGLLKLVTLAVVSSVIILHILVHCSAHYCTGIYIYISAYETFQGTKTKHMELYSNKRIPCKNLIQKMIHHTYMNVQIQ